MRKRWALAFAFALWAAGAAQAWHAPGHELAVRLALRSLPEEAPAFLREGGALTGHVSVDPDLFRPRALPQLRSAEAPEHYFDMELLEGATLPPTRYDLLRLCFERDLDPTKVGTLPYAVAEWTQRLAVALAEHRKWPDNAHVRAKSLVYAGLLSHYAADLTMPLHTTVHFDGRVGPDGRSPRTGIHQRADALLHKAPEPESLLARVRPQAMDDLWQGVLAELNASHALVDKVYELEASMPDLEAPLEPGTPVAAFAQERLVATSRFLGSLYLTAWELSGELSVPGWLER